MLITFFEYVLCYSSAFFLGVVCGVAAVLVVFNYKESEDGKRGR